MNAANRLVRALSKDDQALISDSFERVDLTVRQVLEAPLGDIDHVYFVERGMVSVVARSEPHHQIEVGMIGYEGMTGLAVILGEAASPNESIVQSAGSALRLPTRALHEAMDGSPTLTRLLLRYVHVFVVQSSQTALANGRGKLSERLARWLLMWSDRLQSDQVTVTHEFLAILLGVRRPGVTVTIHELEGHALIKAKRNTVIILDRTGLEQAANGLYGVPEAEYERAMRPPAS
jgi:CRP-like cAMP-binding protein